MKLSPTKSPFSYRSSLLYGEDVPLSYVAEAADTPVYVYSRAALLQAARAFIDTSESIAPGRSLVCYAVKANGNPALLR
jgi:diaminopimelate decarboxylase